MKKPKEIIRYTYEERQAVEFWLVVDEGEEPSEETIKKIGGEEVQREDIEEHVFKGMRKRVENVEKTEGMAVFQVEDGEEWEILDLKEIIDESLEIREERKRIAAFEALQEELFK